MHHQDEVARRLMRAPAVEMHRAMYRYGTQRMASWEKISKEAYTSTFLLVHGWTLHEYIVECRDYIEKHNKRGTYASFMCKEFVRGVENG